MTYQDRFRELMSKVTISPGHPDTEAVTNHILAFIEDECTEVGSKALYEGQKLGRAAEREELAAHVEGMKLEQLGDAPPLEISEVAYNQALDDLLAHLRQSEPLSCGCRCHKGSKRENACPHCSTRLSDTPQGCCGKCRQSRQDFAGETKLGEPYITCTNAACKCHFFDWVFCKKDCKEPCHKKAPHGDNTQ